MDKLAKTSQFLGKMARLGFSVINAKLEDNSPYKFYIIHSSEPDNEQNIINVYEQEGFTGIVCGFQSTPQDQSISAEDFDPYYWVRAVPPEELK